MNVVCNFKTVHPLFSFSNQNYNKSSQNTIYSFFATCFGLKGRHLLPFGPKHLVGNNRINSVLTGFVVILNGV
jgi:hypothetical protein